MSKLSVQGTNRKGKGFYPPNPNQWNFETNGLDLRDELSLPYYDHLSHDLAFSTLDNVTVLPHGKIQMPQKFIDHFRNSGSKKWSGIGISYPTGDILVVYNDSHPINRVRTTLMEELFHIRLNHPKSLIRYYPEHGSHRTFNSEIEKEAYNSGAAALLPYYGLKQAIESGMSTKQIAQEYIVSKDLVIYRAKVTKLFNKLN